MQGKKVSLLINPRTGENVAKLPAILAVLDAVGWKVSIDLKEYGKHVMELARKAASEGDDLVLAYGGDGTINQVVNGLMSTEHKRSAIGVMPGGTANVWAGEIGVPTDPVKASLALIDSDIRKVDVGQIMLHSIAFPADQTADSGKKGKKGKSKTGGKKKGLVRHHFLLMAGLGFDASVMQGVSKPLKYRIGPLAVGLAVAKKLPTQHPFPLEIRDADAAKDDKPLWTGEAVQVVIGNTRRYAKVATITPDAHIDDGILDVCVILNGDPILMMGQISSLLLRLKPDKTTADYLRGRRFLITVPASVPFQVDGSAVQLKDYVSTADYARLQEEDAEKVRITYQIEALPHALRVAIPRTYDDELFTHEHSDNQKGSSEKEERRDEASFESETQSEHKNTTNTHGFSLFSHNADMTETAAQQHTTAVMSEAATQQEETQKKAEDAPAKDMPSKDEKQELLKDLESLIEHGWKVKVIGKVVDPAREKTFIIAGTTQKQLTGEVMPMALVVDGQTELFDHKGRHLSDVERAMQSLHADALIVVEGKKNKRNVLRVQRIVL